MNVSLLRKPSALLPIALSLAALLWLLWNVAMVGIVRQADEGTPARIFQLLILAEVPVIAYFAIKWLPQSPRQALLIVALQAAVAFIPIAAVLLLESGMYAK